jgi:hypothetical protein
MNSMEIAYGPDNAVAGYVLGWEASTGRVYDVQYLADLCGDVWLPMDGLTNLAPRQPYLSVTNLFHDGRLRMLRLQVREP